jgi:hypothetical protein
MPIYNKKDEKGYYFQYGLHGVKYYYNPKSKLSKLEARKKAIRQTAAIHIMKKFKQKYQF